MPDEISRIREIQHCSEQGLQALQSLIKLYGLDKASYLYKARVKDAESVKKKLALKRQKRPHYQLTDVKDFIGLRFLCLFKEDLPNLVRQIFSTINSNSMARSDGHGRQIYFSGESLVDSLEEAVIYLPNREKDIPYELVIDLFRHQKVTVVDESCDGAAPKPGPGIVLVQRKEFEYSSIHLIVRVGGDFAGLPPGFPELGGIPIEIQIRTAFEDIWAEVDHKTIYKTFEDSAATTGDDQGRTSQKKSFAPIARQLSTILKRHIEACSDTADHIKAFVRQLDDPALPPNRPSDSLYPQRIRSAAKSAGAWDATFEKFTAMLGEIYDEKKASLKNIDTAIELANALCVTHNLKPGSTYSNDSLADLKHLLNCELALLYMQRGVFLRQHAIQASTSADTSPDNDFHKAFFIYNSLSRDERGNTDPVVYYRLATLQYYLTGEHVSALSYLKEAQKRLRDPASAKWLDSDPSLRLDVMTRIAFEFYSVGDEIRISKSGTHDDERQAECYLKSAEVALDIIERLSLKGVTNDRQKNELILCGAMNTALDATVQFLRTLGATSFRDSKVPALLQQANVSFDKLREFADTLLKYPGKTPAVLDTLRNFYAFSGELALARTAASNLIKLFEDDKIAWIERYKAQPGYLDEMLECARALLAKGDKKGTRRR